MPRWFHKIDGSFRAQIVDGGKDYASIGKKCDIVISQLRKFEKIALKFIAQSGVQWSRFQDSIEEAIDHFEFCKSFATGEISRDEWDDYDFDGDLVGMYDGYLSEFYDICDTWVDDKTRFCFVGL